ncbi:hypothetical protein [Devosia nitrariae]|uniref:hypothetical protein n=1 Tax=Devosia nitrariae TaxID=2071872 RepID=UPI0024E09888|nr:hypothetical protein [Devosia nitrariae]
MNIEPTVSLGQILSIVVPIILGGLGIYGAYLIFRTKTETSLAAVGEQLVDTNKRVSDLSAGAVTVSNELRDFRSHVERHFVEKDEIAELRLSVDKSIDRMQASLDTATATMGDVRDAVIALTASGGKSTVPAARRPSRSKTLT